MIKTSHSCTARKDRFRDVQIPILFLNRATWAAEPNQSRHNKTPFLDGMKLSNNLLYYTDTTRFLCYFPVSWWKITRCYLPMWSIGCVNTLKGRSYFAFYKPKSSVIWKVENVVTKNRIDFGFLSVVQLIFFIYNPICNANIVQNVITIPKSWHFLHGSNSDCQATIVLQSSLYKYFLPILRWTNRVILHSAIFKYLTT